MTGKPSWAQKTITVTSPSRGCHVITREIERQMPELREFKVGMANVFLKHTSASITLNENVSHEGLALVTFRFVTRNGHKYAIRTELFTASILNTRRTDDDPSITDPTQETCAI